MPSATLSRIARMRSPLFRNSSSARRRSMNWPIWLPIPAITRRAPRSSVRISLLKSAITPVTLRPLVTAKANLVCKPAFAAAAARGESRSLATSRIELGRPVAQTHPASNRQLAIGLLVECEVLSGPVPIVFPPERLRVVIDDPEFADGPSKGLADSLQYLGRRLRPATGIGERASHCELDVAQPLGNPALADVVDEGDERNLLAGPRGGGDRNLDRELMAVSMDCRQLHGLADDSSLAALDEATESA